MNEKYYKELIKLANKAGKKDDVPVSAIIVKDGKIIAKAYNKRNKKNNTLYHAEIIVINKTCKKLRRWILNDCELYVTLKPCSMCEGAIKQARINKVYYLLDKPIEKKEYDKVEFINANISSQSEQYSKILKHFFQKKRDKKKDI